MNPNPPPKEEDDEPDDADATPLVSGDDLDLYLDEKKIREFK